MDAMTSEMPLPVRKLPGSLGILNPVIVDDLIRLGCRMDGGYVVPRSAAIAADALLSFGVGLNWSFEEDFAKLTPNLVIHAYDNSVNDRTFADQIIAEWKNFMRAQGSLSEVRGVIEFYESYRDFFRGKVVHFQERVFNKVENPNDVTVDTILARLEGLEHLALKMDIEGGEYRILDALLAYHQRIGLMVIEFHATQFIRDVFLTNIARIREHYEIVHLHGNNWVSLAPDGLPDVLEVTFLHKTLCTDAPRRTRLPLAGLDFPNNPARADHEIQFSSER